MTFPEISLAAAGLALSGLVKGVTGIGYATCAMPLLAMAVGLETALALVVVPALVSNIAVIASGRNLLRTVARFRLFYLAILPGIACGTLLLGQLDQRIATHGLAFLTVAYVVLAVIRPNLAMPARLEKPLALPAGFVNGVLTGLTGSQILPLVPYMLALRLDAQTQVQAINLAVAIAAVTLGAALFATGIMTPELLSLSALGALPAIAGTGAGNFLRGHLPIEALRRLTLAALLVSAVGLSGREAIEATLNAACGPPASATPTHQAVANCLASFVPPSAETVDRPTEPSP